MSARKAAPNDSGETPSGGPAQPGIGHVAADAPRPRGRPRSVIDLDAVADAVEGLYVEGGIDAVSIGSAAQKLDVSRATLYRTVSNKEDLVGILFERSMREQVEHLSVLVDADIPVRDQLIQLIELQIEAAVRMRGYMPVFFGGAGLPVDVFDRWHAWSREYEAMWARCVAKAMDERVLVRTDVASTTRLILGMCLWVSRWYRPSEGMDTAEIAHNAIRLLFPKVSDES